MVSVIAFLTITNVALGYGLAIYIQRNFGTLVFSRQKKQQVSPGKQLEATEAGSTAKKRASLPPSATKSDPEQTVSKVEGESHLMAGSAPENIVGAAVDEENVLAGIEEFRSQLAKMSESPDSIAAEPERDLAGTAN